MRLTVKPLLYWLNVTFWVRNMTYTYHKLGHKSKWNHSKILVKSTTTFNKKLHCMRFYYFCLIFCPVIIFQKNRHSDDTKSAYLNTSNSPVLVELWEIWLISRFCLLLPFALPDKPFSFAFGSAFYVNKTETKTTISIKTNLNIWH